MRLTIYADADPNYLILVGPKRCIEIDHIKVACGGSHITHSTGPILNRKTIVKLLM